VKRIALAAVLAALASVAGANEPLPAVPFLRIDTARHAAFVHALTLDEVAGRVYTASEDKTVRVWRISDGRLLDTFRVPSGLRAEGQLYALALSPDRRLIAVAGWTCWETEGRSCVYLLNAATGAIVARLRGLEEVVSAVRFSPDGRHLAVGLMGMQGVRVFRVQDGALVAADRDYRDKLLELDFSPGGRLVTASLDGFLRVYDERFVLSGRVNAGLAGQEPFGIRHSRDGRLLAVGFNDVPRVTVLQASDLSVIATLVGSGTRNLTRVAWSPDGTVIFAAGETSNSDASALFRWRLSNPSHAEPLPAAIGRIGDLAVTRDNLLLFGAEDPTLGVVDPAGRIRYALRTGIPDYRTLPGRLRVSGDGSVVEIPAAPGARRFSLTTQKLESVAPNAAPLPAPRISAAGWRIEGWGGDVPPKLNGRPLPLEPFELARAYAFAPDGTALFVGTEWALRAFDRTGAVKWTVRTPTLVRAVTVSGDGRFVVAALGDGSIHWHSLQEGLPAVSLFVHADGEGWVAWTPEGQYSSSAYGDTLVGWHINRGADIAPDFFRAVQFERELFRPDVIAARLRTLAPAPDARTLLAIAPPRVSVTPLEGGRVRVSAESSGLPMREMSVYVNDIPIVLARNRTLTQRESMRFVRDVPIPLAGPDNDVRAEVFNDRSMGVTERYVQGPPTAVAAQRGDLYVLAIGSNQFPELSPDQYLSYAARDAEEFAATLQAIGTNRFRRVHVHTLSDSKHPATRAAVLEALRWLSQPTGNDTTVLFMASHGLSDSAGNYYFVPRDVRRDDLDRLLEGESLAPDSSLVGWLPIFDALRAVAGRRVLVVDTCQARNVSGRFQDFSLVKRSASSHIAFVLASKGDEESQEYAQARHGLFTYALLEGLRGAADFDRNRRITVDEWFSFAARRVDELRDRTIGPQTPQLIAPPALRAMTLMP
jgi:hypothetical protein